MLRFENFLYRCLLSSIGRVVHHHCKQVSPGFLPTPGACNRTPAYAEFFLKLFYSGFLWSGEKIHSLKELNKVMSYDELLCDQNCHSGIVKPSWIEYACREYNQKLKVCPEGFAF